MADPMKVCASCVRGMLVSAPGKDLLALDFAGIESRGTAWVAGETWALEAFRKQDSEGGPDNYEIAYANTFGIDPEDVTKDQRQKGKPIDLSMGFEGGVSALVMMAKTYRVKLTDIVNAMQPRLTPDLVESSVWLLGKTGDRGLGRHTFIALDAVKQLWRQNHPATVRLWRYLRDAAILAVQNPGKVYGIPNGKLKFSVGDRWLYMRLPSGRRLAYLDPEVHFEQVKCLACRNPKTGRVIRNDCEQCAGSGYVKGRPYVTYMGIDTKTRQWTRTSSYGGKWTENAVQALSADLLRNGMFAVEAAGYPIVMTVHDEIVMEVDEDFGSLEEVTRLMCALPEWARGLPVVAEGWRGKRYRK